MQGGKNKKRVMPRLKANLKVNFGPVGQDTDRTGITTDISPRGLFVATAHPFELGQMLSLVIELDDGPVDLTGEVAWRRRAGRHLRRMTPSGLGIKLTHAPEAWYHLFSEC